MPSAELIPGDCLAAMAQMARDGVLFDAVVTDPPYELGFMNRKWDNTGIAFQVDTWRLAYDVLKPGAFMVAFSSCRTYHRMVCAIEDAGFVIHPLVAWINGQGFPKASRFDQPELAGWRYGLQAMKPAIEPICLAQKPMEGTGSQNWAKHGVGGLNIDACRVGYVDDVDMDRARVPQPIFNSPTGKIYNMQAGEGRNGEVFDPSKGRWPANVVHSGDQMVLDLFAAFGERKSGGTNGHRKGGGNNAMSSLNYERTYTGGQEPDTGTAARFFKSCEYTEEESAACRFHYSAKASRQDRAGSKHPTVKPLSLMRWLVTLVTPPGGRILDPFAGSGTTLQAAVECGFDAVGCEQEREYQADIRRRLGMPQPANEDATDHAHADTVRDDVAAMVAGD